MGTGYNFVLKRKIEGRRWKGKMKGRKGEEMDNGHFPHCAVAAEFYYISRRWRNEEEGGQQLKIKDSNSHRVLIEFA